MTMATQWSYKPHDRYKPARDILSILVQIVSRGGNLLLNVGPGPDGELDPTAYERLREIGDWMKVNSEGIYGTKAVAPYKEEKIAFTSKGNDIYAFYLADENEKTMPAKVLVRSFVPVDAQGVTLLGYKKPLKWKKVADGVEIEIPASLRNTPPCDYIWGFRMKVRK